MKKILVTGGTGLVGTALQKILTGTFIQSNDCDLQDFQQTLTLFQKIKPDIVIHLAACVGGLYKNLTQKVDMFEKNILINVNVLKCCHMVGCTKCISCLSTCIFPDVTTYPINEKMLHNGPPHKSNEYYAYAKRMLEIHSKAYREQYGYDFICIIPTNIYGPNDNFNLEDGHVIPSLIHKCFLAKRKNEDFIVRGTGKPMRQFIYSEDLAKLIVLIIKQYKGKDNVIISDSAEISIKDVALMIADAFDYKNKIRFDTSFSDGQYKKTADNSNLIEQLGKYNFVKMELGIKQTVRWFIQNYDTCRN